MTTTVLWWEEHRERIEKCEKQNTILKAEVKRLSEMVEILVGKVHDLETYG